MENFSTLKQPIRIPLLCAMMATFIFWGTSWEVPFIGIPPSYVWIGLCLLTSIFIPGGSIPNKDGAIIGLILFSFLFHTIIGLPNILSSDDISRDVSYVINYNIKILIGGISVFFLSNLIRSEKDLRLSSLVASLVLIPVTFFLYWLYIVVFDVSFIGVVLSDAQKMGKNSFATAIALFAPYFFINYNQGKFYKLISLLAIISLLILLIYMQSRSMLLICFIELCAFLYFTNSKRSKRILKFAISAIIIAFLLAGAFLTSYITKTGAFDDPTEYADGTIIVQDDTIIDSLSGYFQSTHRAWLITQAVSGFIKNSGIGHGVATFRIRDDEPYCPPSMPCFPKSRTETHNDYVLILYEQGILGIGILIYFFYYRFSISKKLVLKTENTILRASLASIIGLVFSLLFINLVQTLVFWMLIALNIIVVRIIESNYFERNT